ncbi:hypothetical protein [Prosthecobacter sp.]
MFDSRYWIFVLVLVLVLLLVLLLVLELVLDHSASMKAKTIKQP